MSRKYILDANVVSYFQRAGQLKDIAAASTVCPWVIVDEVEDELSRTQSSSFKEAAFRVLRDYAVPVIPIRPETREEGLFQRLHKSWQRRNSDPRKNRGEAASIAVATFDTSLVFVTHDTAAAGIALAELYSAVGERCIRTPTFLRRLVELGVLDRAAVCHWVRCNALKFPLWWEEWLAGT